MDAIRDMLALRSSVLREGERHSITSDTLVPGDIVLLEAGDKVPADLRLIKANGLQIQEAILTGESVAVEKQTAAVEEGASLGDRFCMAYSGTTVTRGQGTGIVVATGAQTEIGHISGLLSEVKTLSTPLVEQMAVMAKLLTIILLIVALLIFLMGYFYLQHAFADLFMAVVGLFVAAIPEGLPAVLTITLSVGVQAMARRNAIVRRLPAIETLGSVSVICSDKTGTLTRNEMNVATVVTGREIYRIEGSGYEPSGNIYKGEEVVDAENNPLLLELGQAAALCNDAELQREGETWSIEGDPMEGALLAFSAKIGRSASETRRHWRRTDVIPFDTEHKFMATLNHDHNDHAAVFVKGAPETIFTMCRHQCRGKEENESFNLEYWQQQAESIAGQGQRVLALATRPIQPEHTVLEHDDVEANLILLGLVGLIDPPRSEAIEAVAECHRAGIEVKMITGDHAATALAIGRQIGLKHTDKVLTGAEIDKLDDEMLASAVTETGVFARTSPEHKLRLVMALQSNGMTVAMTGDGVNDAPALKRAGAGIAMGKSGSEAAKEAAEIVLADDNFASIVAAIREGRTVYDNIKKVISWTLPTNAGEAMTIILALMLGLALPITPIQILWINMITAVTLGIALAFEPTEKNTMRRPPRLRTEPLLNGSLVWHIVLVAGLFLVSVFGMYDYAVERGYSENLSRTIAMNTLVVLEIFHLFYIRNMYGSLFNWKTSQSSAAVWIAVATVVVGQLCITYLPWLQTIFQTEPISLMDGGIVLILILETEKWLRVHLFGKS